MNSSIKLVKTSQVLYFFLVMVFLAFVCVYQYSGDTTIHNNIILLFSLLLLPVFDQIFNLLKETFIHYRPKNVGELLLEIGVPMALVGMYVLQFISFGFFIAGITIFALLRTWDARIFFAAALLVFCYIALYLIFGQEIQAEKLSIQVYYMLFAGVVVQIGESIRASKTSLS